MAPRAALAKWLRSTVGRGVGSRYKVAKTQNSQPWASAIQRSTPCSSGLDLWVRSKFTLPFGGRRLGSQRDQGWIPGLLFLITVTLREPEYNPYVPVTGRRTLDEIVDVKDPTWFLAASAPSKYSDSSPRGPLKLCSQTLEPGTRGHPTWLELALIHHHAPRFTGALLSDGLKTSRSLWDVPITVI